MRPLPVIATIREAYDFTFTHLGAIIALIWVPMVLTAIGAFFAGQHLSAPIQQHIAAGNPGAAGPLVFLFFFYALASLALHAVMLTGVTQLALGQRQAGPMAHFAFGALEWRVFRNLFGVVLFLFPGYLLMTLASGQAGVGGGAPTPEGALAAVIGLLIVGAMVFFAVRVAGVLLPVTVNEEKQGIVKSWSLTAGNFWRLVGIFLGALLPVYFVFLIAASLILQGSLPGGTTTPDPEQVMAAYNANLPLLSGLQFLLAPLFIGLAVGASVISWRKLTARTDIVA